MKYALLLSFLAMPLFGQAPMPGSGGGSGGGGGLALAGTPATNAVLSYNGSAAADSGVVVNSGVLTAAGFQTFGTGGTQITFSEGSAPATPSANQRVLWADIAQHWLRTTDYNGVNWMLMRSTAVGVSGNGVMWNADGSLGDLGYAPPSSAGSMTWPSAAGFALYGGSSAWGTSFVPASTAVPFGNGSTFLQDATNFYYTNATHALTISGAFSASSLGGTLTNTSGYPPHNITTALYCLTSTGSATAELCSTSPSYTPASGDVILFGPDTANTGAFTLNVDSLGAKSVYHNGAALVGGEIKAGVPVFLTYNGTQWTMPPAAILIASGALALATSSISTTTCQSVSAGSTNSAVATGVATTDVIQYSVNGSIKAVTGFVPGTTGGLSIVGYPTAGYVNWDVCNWESGSVTPGAVTLNWAVYR